ncbi:MAG: UvrD-helicase domain-containing protein [Chloroflexi bacterium]|nr:UvrD-helicase domain-containing protein [Chloroflexota bacterium]MDA1240410.1 UvrD-helicase domain-containing protein [Chloroflexota bacterium]
MTTSLHDTLNPAQRRAVETPGGPLMILAGPGSGKTRVIAHRIAYLVQEAGVSPWRILAVTFTNKAAREMRERVEGLLGPEAARLSMGTFHSVCARILRRDGEAIGLTRDFVIYDTDDQMSLIRTIEAELQIDPKRFQPRAVLSAISAAKNERRDAAAFQRSVDSYFEEIVARVYEKYEAALRRSGAVDFDDLLGRTLEMFETRPEVQERYAERYLHTLIDEFQDTNLVQYRLARELSSTHRNLTVVGDPDQSIYSWRAADIRNILNFEEDFPDAQVVLLEQNYRSTGHILRASHAVIQQAEGRPEKNLWTENPDGEPVIEFEASYSEEEGQFISGEIRRLIRVDGRSPGDFAVMYRTNAQSRAIEEAFLASGVRYRIVGGTRFYDRKEIRDLIAYLRLIHNEYDTVAFERIVNVPTRGIGARTVAEVSSAAAEAGLSPVAMAHRAAAGDPSPGVPVLASRARGALIAFVQMYDRLRDSRGEASVSTLLDRVLEEIGYREHLKKTEGEHAEVRWENVQELRAVANEYQEVEEDSTLASFLEEVALVSDVDDPSADQPDSVTLITLHAAKGLEYPVVFLAGMEEGILPHVRSLDDPKQMEEERRVCYVGMTRARERLYLTRAKRRTTYGQLRSNPASRFLSDIPDADIVAPLGAAPRGDSWDASQPGGGLRAAAAARRIEVDTETPVFSPGQRVQHNTFGVGVVISCEIVPGDQQVQVAFPGKGVKKLLQSFARLEPAE